MSQWFDDAVSVRPDWAAECGASVETAVDGVPCYVQDPCSLSFMSQVCASYVAIGTCASSLTCLD